VLLSNLGLTVFVRYLVDVFKQVPIVGPQGKKGILGIETSTIFSLSLTTTTTKHTHTHTLKDHHVAEMKNPNNKLG
jgi:hypothetical protein